MGEDQFPLITMGAAAGSYTGATYTCEAGVLVETQSPCNTPACPVLKADKSKYRLVHDLRLINYAVQDWPAEVSKSSSITH